MANLDPQVQIKLIEISKEWAEKIDTFKDWEVARKKYVENFDTIYKQLVKTVSEK
jgi:hypothetical protein